MRCLVSGKLSTWNYLEILMFLKRVFHINNMINMFVSFPGCILVFSLVPGMILDDEHIYFFRCLVQLLYMFCILIHDRMSI